MEHLIICDTKEAKHPFYLSFIQQEIFTYEELCYDIEEYPLFFVEEGITEALLQWMIQELGITELSDLQGRSFTNRKLFWEIITCRSYFLPEECRKLLDVYDFYAKLGPVDRKIQMADSYMKQKRYGKALKYYKEAAKHSSNGRIYYNIGVCCSHQWDYEAAKKAYLRAYELTKDKRAIEAYDAVLLLQGKKDLDQKMNTNASKQFLKGWQMLQREWKDNEERRLQKAPKEKQVLQEWKIQYRREME